MAKKQKTGTVAHVVPTTARVRVDRMLRHPLYEKAYRSTKSILAHIPADLMVGKGDVVTIEEIRPVSKHKSWQVISIVESGTILDEVADVDVATPKPEVTQ